MGKVCLRQFMRPDLKLPIRGVGDCTICVTDISNEECNLYVPINITTVDVYVKKNLTNTKR